jgi:quinolinate synthase
MTVDQLYEKLRRIQLNNPLCTYTYERVSRIFPLVEEILALKKEKNAIVLAHTYVHPDIIYGVADFVGDSYYLAKTAKETKASEIVFPSVRFMAESAKLLNPEKKVVDPNPNGGCTLADSLDAQTVQRLKKQHPEHTFVCYINTTVAVKAECDVCVTSSNVVHILERLPSDKIYFVPDKLMGENAADALKKKGIKKEVLSYPGTCYVHEQFGEESVNFMKREHPGLIVLAHPECRPEVVRAADVVGSTSEMQAYVTRHQAKNHPFLLLTECGAASRLQVEAPRARLVGACTMCKYMRSNSLERVRDALKNPKESEIVEIEESIQAKARECIERMFVYAK